MRRTDKSLRIRKLITRHPDMTDRQVARKIGMDSEDGEERVRKERGNAQISIDDFDNGHDHDGSRVVCDGSGS